MSNKPEIPANTAPRSPERKSTRVSLQQIADRCGVSKATVWQALNPRGYGVHPATAERIRAAAAEMGYDCSKVPATHAEEEVAPPLTSVSVTMRDIAERCGVSHATVQRVLQQHGRSVRPALAEQIRAVVAEMGYHPEANFFARRMRSRRQHAETLNHAVTLLNQHGGELHP
ncbi:MAG TPA: LacI family DNA-binding transcriptional regulator, partial [Armatimonadota bacterium]